MEAYLVYSSKWVKKNVLSCSKEHDCLLHHKINAYKEAEIISKNLEELRKKRKGIVKFV